MGKSITKLLVVSIIIAAVLFGAFSDITMLGFRKPSVLDPVNGVRRGLDLTGGSVIGFEAEADNVTPQQMGTVQSIMRKRLDSLGFTEATVTIQGEKRIRIEIPSITDPEEAVKKLGVTAQLKFVDADGNVVLDGTDVKSATKKYGQLSQTSNAENYVELVLNDAGIPKFAAATKAAAARSGEGKNYIAIKLDEDVVSQPSVKEEINSASAVISGSFTAESASELASLISAGQLPFNLKSVELRSIGPTLGEKALETSLFAAMIGIIAILIFMILVYRLPGLAADIALLAYVGLLALIMGLLRVNLTLPGIAGIILSIGMAVDANVVIFERVKEELRNGKTIKAAVGSGFKRAFSAIVDSNITTIIAAFVLFIYGTGLIKGFAITLGLGVIVSMFTAIVITKFILVQFATLANKNKRLYGVK